MPLRSYDPTIARWTSQDPVKHYNYSPYSAFDNNPVFWSDPSGADAITDAWIEAAWNNTAEGTSSILTNNDGNLTFNKCGGDCHNKFEQTAQTQYTFFGETPNGGVHNFSHTIRQTVSAFSSDFTRVTRTTTITKYNVQFTTSKDEEGNTKFVVDSSTRNTKTESQTFKNKRENTLFVQRLQHSYAQNDPRSGIVGRKHNYGLNGIEINQDLGIDLYEMPLRSYDPTIGRWTSIDPVKHYSYSTFSAFDNNPVFWSDPSGADSRGADGLTNDEWLYTSDPGYQNGGLSTYQLQDHYNAQALDNFVDNQIAQDQLSSLNGQIALRQAQNSLLGSTDVLDLTDSKTGVRNFSPGAVVVDQKLNRLIAERNGLLGSLGDNGWPPGGSTSFTGAPPSWDYSSFGVASTISLGLLSDNFTGYGVVDDVLIPVAYGVATATFLYNNREIIRSKAQEIVHANSRRSRRPNIVYEIYSFNIISGETATLKYGISSRADFIRRSGNPRPEYQSAALNANEPVGSGNFYWYTILNRTPDRASALILEENYVRSYQATHNGQRPPLQIRP